MKIIIRSGKTVPIVVTESTVYQLERAGSWESAKIAQTLIRNSRKKSWLRGLRKGKG